MYKRGDITFRLPEIEDLDRFYAMRNDEDAIRSLGGYSAGMSKKAATEWLIARGSPGRDLIFMIIHPESGLIGHVGLYEIDHRIRMGEFAILIGDKNYWGRGIGESATRFMINYGFDNLNLNRVQLEVLSTNQRAIKLYERVGFTLEGTRRQVQYKDGQYIDSHLMSVLRNDAE
ncbi:GNAT family N-acetyltransferase [Deinococcus yunweiensis]|uniref:GNAT family N-acetyltransferase n=1 Tax=Deinococcus yunweiensis TaxID=367282 RepID=UPI00398E51C8